MVLLVSRQNLLGETQQSHSQLSSTRRLPVTDSWA